MEQFFKNIVGQEKAKRELSFYVSSYFKTRIMPNLLIVAPKGQGKTMMAREIGNELIQFNEHNEPIQVPSLADPNKTILKRKTFLEVNCSSIKNLKSFINSFIIPYVQNKDVTVLFDEASEIKREVSMALLTMLNPNPDNRTTFSFEDFTCDFDFRRQTFLFATSESHQVFHALADRLERVTLEAYTIADLAQIIQRGIGPVTCQPGLLEEIATVLRGNARAAQKMSNKIKAYLQGRDAFYRCHWFELKKILGIYPLGLNAIEIDILRFLAQHGEGSSLTNLSAKTGMSRESLQKDSEIFLQKNDLMAIKTTGRVITSKGLLYLKELDVMEA